MHIFDGLERRNSQRCPIDRPILYQDIAGEDLAVIGHGQTVNLSHNGLLFTTEHELRPGKKLEVSIGWPGKVDGNCHLNLVTTGRVVRVRGSQAAMEVQRFEFRPANTAFSKPV